MQQTVLMRMMDLTRQTELTQWTYSTRRSLRGVALDGGDAVHGVDIVETATFSLRVHLVERANGRSRQRHQGHLIGYSDELVVVIVEGTTFVVLLMRCQTPS